MLTEIQSDLFTHDNPQVCLAHCVSADFVMGKGIAVGFRDRYGCVPELRATHTPVGGVAILTNQTNSRSIYYLVTKELCYHRPDINTVLNTIILLKRHMMEKGYRKLVIPRLGCGLDQLSWTVMKPLIEEIFLNTGIEITVCYL